MSGEDPAEGGDGDAAGGSPASGGQGGAPASGGQGDAPASGGQGDAPASGEPGADQAQVPVGGGDEHRDNPEGVARAREDETGVRDRLPTLVGLVATGVVAGLLLWVVLPVGPASGTVAVVPVEGGINGNVADAYGDALDRALADPSVEAVVLRVSSPGGSATASESMYLRTVAATSAVPVVASVDSMAASGGYYVVAPSDHVVTKPASLVGSVGAVFPLPADAQPTEDVVVTGPGKLAGDSQRGWYYKTQTIRNAFLDAVVRHRGDDLTVSRATVASGKLFTGIEAGLADDVGSTRDAIERAAAMADLASYDVRVYRGNATRRFLTRTNYLAATASRKTMVSPRYFLGSPTSRFPNQLLLPPELLRTAVDRGDANVTLVVPPANGSAPPTTPEVTDGGP